MTAKVHLRKWSTSDVARTSFGLHERPLACVDGWERFMFEVLSKMRSSMIVPQGNPLLATGLCLPTAHCCPPVTSRPFPLSHDWALSTMPGHEPGVLSLTSGLDKGAFAHAGLAKPRIDC
jgi:hypothetical protein